MANTANELECKLRRDLVRFGRWLYRLGYMPGTAGNLSVRLDERRILATPTGASKYLLRSADMVIVELGGRQLSGSRKVTSEIGMHLAVYRLRDDIEAVIHSHPPVATAYACTGQSLDKPICAEAIMALGPVPLARYATTGTEEVEASLLPLIPDHEAILMANHGAVTYAGTLLDAFLRMETVEHYANVCLAANQLGCVRPIAQEQVEQLLLAKARYLANAM